MEPVQNELEETSANRFDGWLDVDEAYAHVLSKGLSRTKKTIRKWATRDKIEHTRIDTPNGKTKFLFNPNALEVKIEEEKALDARKPKQETSSHPSEPVRTRTNPSEPVSFEKLIKAKDDTIEILKGELAKSNEQHERKDIQINTLNKSLDVVAERLRESNIIMARQLGLEAPSEEKGGDASHPLPEATHTSTGPENPEPAAKEGDTDENEEKKSATVVSDASPEPTVPPWHQKRDGGGAREE